MHSVVITQPMYFPWIGMHEQMRLADDYVDYSDVAFSKGSFTNRVQIKTQAGSTWLTLPLQDVSLGQFIAEIALNEGQNWRKRHRSTLAQAYARAPFVADMLAIVDEVFDSTGNLLDEVTLRSMIAAHTNFGFARPLRYHSSHELGITGSGSERVLQIVRHLGGDCYITGHGAQNYLDHQAFSQSRIEVGYLDYQKCPYPQLHGDFTPFVSALDLVANCGREGRRFICSNTKPWQHFTS